MADDQGERAITSDFVRWLREEKPGWVCVEQFQLPEGGIVDLSAFGWTDGLELQCWAIECKKKATMSNIYGYLKQMARYQSAFPKVYLTVRTIRDEEKNSLARVCEASRMGLYVTRSHEDVERISEAE